jgi:excisionase family DNA binding protein
VTSNEQERLLTPKEAADHLRVSETTLRRWRRENTGPPYVRMGRVYRYRLGALIEWLRAKEAEQQGG